MTAYQNYIVIWYDPVESPQKTMVEICFEDITFFEPLLFLNLDSSDLQTCRNFINRYSYVKTGPPLKFARGLMCKINLHTKHNTHNVAFLRIIHLENINFYLLFLFSDFSNCKLQTCKLCKLYIVLFKTYQIVKINVN